MIWNILMALRPNLFVTVYTNTLYYTKLTIFRTNDPLVQSSPLPRLTLHSSAPECSGCMVRTGSSSTPLLALWLSSSNLSRINKVICQQHPVEMMLAVVLVLTLNTSWALCSYAHGASCCSRDIH